MTFAIKLTPEAKAIYEDLKSNANNADKLKKVRKTLGLLQTNPRHPGRNSHRYESMVGPNGEEVWESYVENRTPSAWRIWWVYDPDRGQLTIVTIGPHPD